MIDCFMVAADEPGANENWARLQACLPAARHVPSQGGIFDSYRHCASLSDSEHFWVVDADNWMVDGFEFAWSHAPQPGHVFVWRARNPVNGLVYGHGAIKLFHVSDLLTKRTAAGVDVTMTTTAVYKIVDVLASEHRFNVTPLHSWRTAFRECVKLASSQQTGNAARVSEQRLSAWQSIKFDAPNGDWCLRGARDGAAYGQLHRANADALARINDYAWLSAQFAQAVSEGDTHAV